MTSFKETLEEMRETVNVFINQEYGEDREGEPNCRLAETLKTILDSFLEGEE